MLHVLTESHGRHAGLVPGGAGRAKRGTFQPGNELACRWRARLPEHLGTFSAELARARAGPLLGDAARLAGLGAACAVVDALLPEREPHAA
ncbi:MAG: recombination protein O N-terminal domain-containing protein, partial [Alphaproteobacteria bacterium]|nr:recombination protein O N-terminal domain-containing protein [Alphaproteobacteria bacterium]